MTEKRFRYDWKTGGFKDTQSNSCATTNMRVLETQINDACFNYEKKINELEKENKKLKKQLGKEETDKKRLMSFLIKYKGYLFDEIVEDILDEPYYDNWWEDGFYEYCWEEYLKEKGFDGFGWND